MSITLRDYQQRAIDELFAWFANGGEGNPLMVLPTAAGKSIILAAIIKTIFDQWPGQRVLMLTHVGELILQNYEKLLSIWPDAPAGIYSAGIGRKEHDKDIVYASIQSIHRKASEIGHFELIFIDEAHLVPNKRIGTYRKFIDDCRAINPQLRVVGLTATPFRLGSGYLYTGDDAIFSAVATEVSVNELLEKGYLSPLISQNTKVKVDLSNVKKVAGEFKESDVERAFDCVLISALDEIIDRGADRNKWLIFNTSIDHAEESKAYLLSRGISAEIVTGSTPKEQREQIIADYKRGKYRALCNCQVLTTGFDAPGIDLVAILRATESTALYIQICGRGMRLAEGKNNCLVLDYGGNIERHGCVDDPIIKTPKEERGDQEAPVKICPKCEAYCHASVRVCPYCAHSFPAPIPKIESESSKSALLTKFRTPEMCEVAGIMLKKWKPIGKPKPTLMVSYLGSGMMRQELAREWMCFEHEGYPKQLACKWWAQCGGDQPFPTSVDEAISRKDEINHPNNIEIEKDGRYYKVKRRFFNLESAC